MIERKNKNTKNIKMISQTSFLKSMNYFKVMTEHKISCYNADKMQIA